MPVDASVPTFLLDSLIFIFDVGFVLFATAYFLFSLILVRQVHLMTETVLTEGGAILRAFGIFHSGIALLLVILFIWFV